jgi:SsrA-binding protein
MISTEISYNRKAKFDYDLLEEVSAGIVLTGHEVKSAKMGRMDLSGSYVALVNGEAFLLGSKIQSFQSGNAPEGYDVERTRKLLFHAAELKKLADKKNEGLSLIPIRARIVRSRVKVDVAVARGRKAHDKREHIKKREVKREISRGLRSK